MGSKSSGVQTSIVGSVNWASAIFWISSSSLPSIIYSVTFRLGAIYIVPFSNILIIAFVAVQNLFNDDLNASKLLSIRFTRSTFIMLASALEATSAFLYFSFLSGFRYLIA